MRNLILILVMILSLPFFGFAAENSEVEKNYQAALLENKKYAAQMAELESLQKAEKKIAYQYADGKDELRKTLDEYYQVMEALKTEKDDKLPGELQGKFMALRRAVRKELLHSDEYIRIEQKSLILCLKMNLRANQIASDSTDPRVIKYKEFLSEYIDNSFKQLAHKMPKDDCEGSDEFRAAMHVAKLYKKDPLKYKWQMVHCNAGLLNKVHILAASDPAVKKAEQTREVVSAQNMIYMASLNEKHLDLYRNAELADMAVLSKDQNATQNAYEQRKILREAYEKDSEYIRLLNDLQNALNDYQKKVDEFVAGSDAPAAMEYRKFSAFMKD